MPERGPKVLVAMSGGVDSSVAAALLLRRGYDVVGCFMRLGSPGEEVGMARADADTCPADAGAPTRGVRIGHQGCCSVGDAADARLVAAELGIPFYVCNFKKDFARVIDYFVGEYSAGRTPNPCVRCNDWLKFGRLHDYARQIDAAWIASGHYARVDRSGPTPALLRGVDHAKDQSYVLFGAPASRLAEMLLPIGEMEKPAVRDLAQRLGLPVFDKPDSQEICFVPDNDYAGFIERVRPDAAGSRGRIVDAQTGETLGVHAGQHRFTVGQRRGIALALHQPVYVVSRDAPTNTIAVGPAEMLQTAGCTAGEVNWLADPAAFTDWAPCLAQFRAHGNPAPARCRLLDGGQRLEVRFDQPQRAVAPGQAVVCYGDGEQTPAERVLGGGWIGATQRAGA